MKTKLLFLTLLYAAFGASLFAQKSPSNPVGANITAADAGSCATVNTFLWQQLPNNAGTTTVNLAGTFVATVTIRESNNGGGTWTTANTLSAAGTTTFSTNGFTDICADVTAYTSGTVQVSLSTGLQQVQSVVSGSSSSASSAPAVQSGTLALDPTCPVVATSTCLFWNADVHVVADATTANTSNIISAPDANFQGTETLNNGTVRPIAKVGQIVFCTSDKLHGTLDLVQTTIQSIDSGTQIHTVANATANHTANAFCAWGDDDTTNIQAAWAATLAKCTAALNMSGGIAFTQKGQFNTVSAGCTSLNNSSFAAPSIFGNAAGDTIIMPTPLFDFATGAGNSCQGGGTGLSGAPPSLGPNTDCFGDFQGEFSNVSIWGLGNQGTGATLNLVLFGTQGRLRNFNALGWMTNLNGASVAYGVLLNSSQVQMSNGCACYFGLYPLVYGAQAAAYEIGNFVEGGLNSLTDSHTSGATNGPAISIDSFIGPDQANGNGATVAVNAGGNLIQIGDFVQGGNTGAGPIALHSVGAGAIGVLQDVVLNPRTGSQPVFRGGGAGAKTYVQNSSVTAGGSQLWNGANATADFFDQGGNSFSTTGTTGVGAANVFGTASASGTVCAVGNFATTSGWGTTTITTAAGDSHRCRMTFHTTVTGAASPVATWTYPVAYPLIAPQSCTLIQVGGTFGTLTNPVPGTPGLSSVAVTFTGTPTATNDYIFDWNCGP